MLTVPRQSPAGTDDRDNADDSGANNVAADGKKHFGRGKAHANEVVSLVEPPSEESGA
jgi:hypothetical protein